MKKLIIFFTILILIIFFWHFFQKKNSQILKIGFITDWEYEQFETEEKAHYQAKDLLSEAVAYFNYIFKPTLVIAGGDYIQPSNINNDQGSIENLKEITTIFNKIKANKFYILGKKDYQIEVLPETKSILSLEETYYSQKFKDIKIVILDTTENNHTETSLGTISENQVKWLKAELKNPGPVMIFSHHSLIETPIKDIWRKNLTNQEALQKIIKNNHQKIIAMVSGNNSTQDYITKQSGVPYINIGSLISKKTLGRFSKITIKKDSKNPTLFNVKIENRGKNSSIYKIKRNLKIKTETRISIVQEDLEKENQKWFDLEDKNHPQGVISEYPAGEPNLNTTQNGTIVAVYENNNQEDKIQVKIFKNNQWKTLADKNYPEGLISLGKAGNPRVITKDEDIFVIFTELDYNQRSRLLKWDNKKQSWETLSKEGFVSEKFSHEPILTFDKDQENLYIAYAEEINPSTKQKQLKVKKWNGINWSEIPTFFQDLTQFSNSSLDEVELKNSKINNSIYLAYEEQTLTDKNIVKVKKLVDSKWEDLDLDSVYKDQITQVNGFSPSLAIDNQENIYLSFVENNQNNIHIYKYNQEEWTDVSPANQTGTAIEPFVAINKTGVLFLGYSEFKKNIVMFKKSEEDFIKTGAWRVRVQKLRNGHWTDCADNFNYGGYITKGSGKGDPALATFNDVLFVIVNDEENSYRARVKSYNE